MNYVADINPFLAKISGAYGQSVYGPRSRESWAMFLGFTETPEGLVASAEPVMLAGFYHKDFITAWPDACDITACCDQAVADLLWQASLYRKLSVVAIEFPQSTQLHITAYAQLHATKELRIHASAFFETSEGKRIDPTGFCRNR